MKDNFCDITIVLDRSGSMSTVIDDTIGGFNTFLEKQQAVPGECNVSLVQFDDQYEVNYAGKPIAEAPRLSRRTFVPRGMTALLDAIGRTINATGARLSAMPEADRPSKVIFVILTDGGENSSREFTREKVFAMITEQREKYAWDFVFLGANQDAIKVGASMGVLQSASMSYASNSIGTRAAFASAANFVKSSRMTGSASFTDEDRKAQEDAGARP